MQLLRSGYDALMHEMQVFEDGEWRSIAPTEVTLLASPYRYDYQRDAKAMLDRLYPDVPVNHKRTVRV